MRGTDPGWALLTYDEWYDRNTHLQMYTDLYKTTVPPQALPAQSTSTSQAAKPPRRLRRGERAVWDDESEDEGVCFHVEAEELKEIEEAYECWEDFEEVESHRKCLEVVDPSEVSGDAAAEATRVPADEGVEEFIPEAESRKSASPELPVPTGA